MPGDTICVIGTTSDRIPYDQIDNMVVTPEEVDVLFREGEKLAPSLRHTRVLRAYAGFVLWLRQTMIRPVVM
ncbi:sn-glycerol-3-phosphate dehydrogenase subunit A [Actinobacillus equuli]|nr:sn-glycerol-3-phosphate dehydrogenase subunit A [Actinobacillus equuli]